MDEKQIGFGAVVGFAFVIALVVGFFMWVVPNYNVWQQGKSGEAKLREADYSRQTKVVEAKANLEAENLNAQAEVVRAQGVAKSNEIIKNSINDQYIKYLWVKTLDGAQKQIIYVPAEANLPLGEAGRAVN